MEVVLRPVNDRFLTEVLFPAFELGVLDAAPAIDHLLRYLDDEQTRVLLDLVLEHSATGSFFGLADEHWNQALYRMLFHEWIRDSEGWSITQPYTGYAGPWEETFHLALMLEDPDYPYDDHHRANLYRRAFWAQPRKRHGLAALLCGAWDPVPSFPPDQVLTQDGNGVYDLRQGLARADWAWRPLLTVAQWAARMPAGLNRLLDREVKRLHPVEPPERFEVLDFWLGRAPTPPGLAVTFSGLGPRAHEWIQELGSMGNVIRGAAAQQLGLTAVISRRPTVLTVDSTR